MPQEVMLKCWHKGEAKYVGKVVNFKDWDVVKGWAFLHEESGSQKMIAFDSPGGIDIPVINYLSEKKIERIVHLVRNKHVCYYVSLDLMLTKGVVRAYAGRNRIYLPELYWNISYDLPPKTKYVTKEKVLGTPPVPIHQVSMMELLDES